MTSPTEVLVAVDPSLRSPGLAVMLGGELVHCERVKIPAAYARLARGSRADAVARLIVAAARGVPALAERMAARDVLRDAEAAGRPADVIASLAAQAAVRVAYEWPQVYVASRSKGDPNDIIPLAAIGAAVAAHLGALDVVAPTPAEWIGQVPKSTTGDPWESPRGARVRVRLSPDELARVPAQHDAIDAAAIALWASGRFERHRVIPR